MTVGNLPERHYAANGRLVLSPPLETAPTNAGFISPLIERPASPASVAVIDRCRRYPSSPRRGHVEDAPGVERGPGNPRPAGRLPPSLVSQNDQIPIRILERDAVLVPVWIRRSHLATAMRSEALRRGLPLRAVGKVENEEIFVGRSGQNRIGRTMRELEMIWPPGMPQNDAVESGVIGERAEKLEAEPLAVESRGGVEVTTRPCDAKVGDGTRLQTRVPVWLYDGRLIAVTRMSKRWHWFPLETRCRRVDDPHRIWRPSGLWRNMPEQLGAFEYQTVADESVHLQFAPRRAAEPVSAVLRDDA